MTRIVGGQEQAGLRDLLRAAQPAEGDALQLLRPARRRLAELRVPLGVTTLGVDGARHHHVDPDARGTQLRGQRPHEAEEPGLGRGDRRGARPPGEARLPAERDDASPPALLHARHHRAGQIESGVEIHREDAVPVLQRGLGDRLVRPDRRVAHEDVDGPEDREAVLDHGLDRVRIADVAQHGRHTYPSLAALLGHRLQLVAVGARVQDEIRPLPREGERDRTADVATGPGDEGGAALKSHGVTPARPAR
jgi:hypothetical protein